MNKIYLPFRVTWVAIIFRKIVCINLFIFFVLIPPVEARQQVENCKLHDFSNVYYLMDSADIASVAVFFNAAIDIAPEGENTSLTRQIGNRYRVFQYFDTPEKQLLANEKELVLIEDKNLPDYRENKKVIRYREIINSNPNFKYFKAKKYNKKNTLMDKHPLFGEVRRKDRLSLLSSIGLPESHVSKLRKTVEVYKNETAYIIQHYGVVKAEIALEEFHISNYGLPNTFSLLKFEFDDSSDDLNSLESQQIKGVLCKIKNIFNQQYPEIKGVSWVGYKTYFELSYRLFPLRGWVEQNLLYYRLIQAIVLGVIGSLFLYLCLGRYKKSTTYKVINSKNEI